MAGVPGIYFHSLFGSRNDRAAADTSGIPRRINRQKMTHSGLNRELADSSSLRSQVFRRYCQLLRIRRDHSAFDPSGSQKIPDLDYRVFAVLREAPDGGERVLCLHNVSAQAVRLALWREQGAPTKEWTELLSQERHAANPTGPVTLSLMPYQVAWLCECAG
jgi:sucrose phosphorylase